MRWGGILISFVCLWCAPSVSADPPTSASPCPALGQLAPHWTAEQIQIIEKMLEKLDPEAQHRLLTLLGAPPSPEPPRDRWRALKKTALWGGGAAFFGALAFGLGFYWDELGKVTSLKGPTPDYQGKLDVFFTSYSRGNDDTNEFDANGESNYETARIWLQLTSVLDKNGKVKLWLNYNAVLATDAGDAYRIGKRFGLREEKNPLKEPQTELQRFDVAELTNPNGFFPPPIAAGKSLGTNLHLGDIGSGTADGEYRGTTRVDGNFGRGKQEIAWFVTVKGGKVTAGGATLVEHPPPGTRGKEEMLVPVLSNWLPSEKLGEPLPQKKGKGSGKAKTG